MVEASQPCVNACDDRRLELVRAPAHDRLVAERDDALRRVELFGALAERLAAGAWDAADARAVLHEAGPAPKLAVEEEDVVSGWWCATCGRFEAPQPCLGICIHVPAELVRLEVHARVEAETAAARDRAERLEALARRAAWARPRPGHEADSARALADEARRLV